MGSKATSPPKNHLQLFADALSAVIRHGAVFSRDPMVGVSPRTVGHNAFVIGNEGITDIANSSKKNYCGAIVLLIADVTLPLRSDAKKHRNRRKIRKGNLPTMVAYLPHILARKCIVHPYLIDAYH